MPCSHKHLGPPISEEMSAHLLGLTRMECTAHIESAFVMHFTVQSGPVDPAVGYHVTARQCVYRRAGRIEMVLMVDMHL